MTIEVSRRDFMKVGGLGLLGAVAVNGVPGVLGRLVPPDKAPMSAPPIEAASDKHYWRFIVNVKKCIGCGKCVRACKLENDVAMEPDNNRTWVERYVVTEGDDMLVDSPDAGINGFKADYMNAKYQNVKIVKSFFVPKLCNQCDKPPCVSVCPVGATYATKEGVVLVDRKACIGCRYCIQACPYGARFFDRRYRIVDKCTWCYHRITRGMPPACVEVCPTGARVFGDTRDPNSEVSKLIREETLGILKPEIGAVNKVYYVGLEKGVR